MTKVKHIANLDIKKDIANTNLELADFQISQQDGVLGKKNQQIFLEYCGPSSKPRL